ncbi:hypothetical protein B9Z19DRAFT_1086316 [Tuber borchii]|uniref:Protein YAE1 n=1 Tax=Tuber borchii TaxID=42251 RepID=A0A2T6ZPL3_TUBBO|nr:hypothetical protein B9Z19DRAFT_1086316 [Tuber borchii]
MRLETPLSSHPSTPSTTPAPSPPPRSSSPPTENPDLTRLRHTHHTHGYLAGITQGKTLHLQSGFDEGYALGGRFGLKIGWVLGALQGLSHIAPAAAAMAVRRELEKAKRELVFDEVFSEEYFAPGGVWLYALVEEGGEEEGGVVTVTLDRVVEMHPVVKRWVGKVRELASWVGVDVEELGLELEREEKGGEEEEEKDGNNNKVGMEAFVEI